MTYTFEDFAKIHGVKTLTSASSGISGLVPETPAAMHALLRMKALPRQYLCEGTQVMLVRCTGAASQNRVVLFVFYAHRPHVPAIVEWHLLELFDGEKDWLPTSPQSFGPLEWVDIQEMALSEFYPAGKNPDYVKTMSDALCAETLRELDRNRLRNRKAHYFSKLPSYLPVLKDADIKAIRAQYELAYDMALKALDMDITDDLSEAAIARAVEKSLEETNLLEWQPKDILENYSPVLLLIPIEGLDIKTFDMIIEHAERLDDSELNENCITSVGVQDMSPELLSHMLNVLRQKTTLSLPCRYAIGVTIRRAIRAKNATVMKWMNEAPYEQVLSCLSMLPSIGSGFPSLMDRALDNPGEFRAWIKANTTYSCEWKSCLDHMESPLLVATYAVAIAWKYKDDALSYHPYTNLDVMRRALTGNVGYLPLLAELLQRDLFTQEEYSYMNDVERALCDKPPTFEELYAMAGA